MWTLTTKSTNLEWNINKSGAKIKRFWYDNAQAYFNQTLSPFLQKERIIHELLNTTKASLFDQKFPKTIERKLCLERLNNQLPTFAGSEI